MSLNNLNTFSIKNGNSNNNNNNNKKGTKLDIPFYEPASTLPTSSQIIKEAREKLHETKKNTKLVYPQEGGLIRTINSTRPFTPRDDKRSLFGPKSTRPVNERPPSSFLIGSKSFDADNSAAPSRPISATRLSPIENKPVNQKLSSQSSIEIEPNQSKNTIEEEQILPVTLPKQLSVISRLAPLEISEKIRSINIQEYEFNPRNSHSASSVTSGQSHSESQVEINWRTNIEPLLNLMNSYFKENQVDLFCESCEALNQMLENFQMYSKNCPKRSIVLKLIFKYLDTENDKMKLKVAKIILNMKVGSNNLTNICRLLFSISRNSENDSIFIKDDIIDPLLSSSKRLDFKTNSDSVIYFCGTMKNLSENQKLLKLLSQRNLEEILSKIIKDLNKYYNNKETLKTEVGNVLVQLTATLRNLADLSSTRHKFLSLNLIEELVAVLKYFSSDSELMLNVSRILSKLTLHSDCCQKIIFYPSIYKSFIKIMLKHDKKQDLIVRVGFILGNITSRHEEARIEFMEEKYSIETIIKTLQVYIDLDQEIEKCQEENLNESEPSLNEDVLIKFVRVIANVAINENAGAILANRPDLFEILLKILDSKDLACEELVIDTIVTINNLSFYNSEIFVNNSHELVNSLMKFLLSNNPDAILEVFRVFANLSRHRSIRNYLINKKVNILATAYLNSNNRELIYIVIGVLINIMSDPENRYVLKSENGIKRLIEILTEVGPTDWQISSMICQLLMNYSEKFDHPTYDNFEKNELITLHTILNELLDEKFALSKQSTNKNDVNENLDEYMYYIWTQDFNPVANLLLKRITRKLENL